MNTELIQYACLPSDLNENILNELWGLRPEEQNKITMFGKTIDTPRRFKVYGKTYKFNGMAEEAEAEIPRLIIPYLNLINTIDSGYNSVLVNWYDGGNEYIGFHSDKTDHLVPNSNIYGISFGSERIMRFKHKEDNTLIDFKLEHNSIINMIGGCQSVFQHSIIQNKKIDGRRISLTFRKIIDTNIIMESKTRPKYNEFLKEWSSKNKITSFFGSDKPEFLQAWNNVKSGGSKIVEPVVEAPAVVNLELEEDQKRYDKEYALIQETLRNTTPEYQAVIARDGVAIHTIVPVAPKSKKIQILKDYYNEIVNSTPEWRKKEFHSGKIGDGTGPPPSVNFILKNNKFLTDIHNGKEFSNDDLNMKIRQNGRLYNVIKDKLKID
jgi:alkylated DNA repair dioxygenase AlkB